MKESMNIPYVKRYDANGTLLNPINGLYKSEFDNRRKRRERPQRFINNRNTFPLTVLKTSRYIRIGQFEIDKEGRPKVIEHYDLVTN